MLKSFAIILCWVFITQQKISTPLSAKIYLGDIYALNSLRNWESFLLWVCACVRACVRACVCVCVCVSIVFLMLSRQLPYLQFHHKIFATNRSQIRVFSEDLIKYIMSFKNCNTICKKKEIKITQKKTITFTKKLQKCTFLTTINLNGNMKLRQMTQFHLSNSFWIWKYSKFFFMLYPLWSILICTIPQFLTKSIFLQNFFDPFG